MKTMLQFLIRRRNPRFRFDPDLDSRVLLQFTVILGMSMLRGLRLLLALRKPKGAMLAAGVTMFAIHKIQWGRFMKLGKHVHLSGLGKGGLQIGDHVGIGAYSRVIVSSSLTALGAHIAIGNRVGIGEYAYLGGAGGLEIGADCIIGQYFSCHPENHVHSEVHLPIRLQGVTHRGISIGSNCWIGSKVTVLDGVSIGVGSVIAAGAVVTRSFPPYSIIGGVPARLLKSRIPTPVL